MIESPDGDMLSRIYWVGRRLYQLIVMTSGDKLQEHPEVARFLDSFKLTGDETAMTQQPAWIDFSPEHGGFVVSMPSNPTQQIMPTKSESTQMNVYVYVSLGPDGAAYLVSYADVPSPPTNQTQTTKALDDVRNGQLESTKGDLKTEAMISLEGNQGRELKIITPTGTIISRIFIVKTRLYQLMAITPEAVVGSEASTRDNARFLSSFKLKSP